MILMISIPHLLKLIFIRLTICRLGLERQYIRDADVQSYLDGLKIDEKLYLDEAITFLDEAVSVVRRLSSAESFFKYCLNRFDFSIKHISIIYKMLLDDEEEIRYTACKICRQVFSTEIINSALFYVDKIWKYVGEQCVDTQRELFQSLFLEPFLDDFSREYKNVKECPIFRVEPQNTYRDYLIETYLITRYVSVAAITVDSSLVETCTGKSNTFLLRNIKCINLLIRR
jgi:hypothetical protein